MEWLFPLRANNGLESIIILTVLSHVTLRMVTSLMVRAEYCAFTMVLGVEIRTKFAVKVWNTVDVMYTQENLNLTSTVVNWNGVVSFQNPLGVSFMVYTLTYHVALDQWAPRKSLR